MKESDVRRKIVECLLPLDAHAVENACNPGTPDIEYIGGWIEVKYIPKWPARENSPLRVDHFTAVQRLWIKKRVRMGGVVIVALRVGDDLLLFNGWDAAEFIGTLPKEDLIDLARCHWENKTNWTEFLQAIRDW